LKSLVHSQSFSKAPDSFKTNRNVCFFFWLVFFFVRKTC
jgi:hypothetical protein